MLKTSFAQISGRCFLGDKKVIRSSIHTPRTFTGQTAAKQMRWLTACDALVCLSVEGANYQPDQNGQDRFELDI